MSASLAFSQGSNYKLDGNNNGTVNSVIGFKNAADLKVITNDTVRQTITKEGDVVIEKNLEVKGNLSVGGRINNPGDTIFVRGVAVMDSVSVHRIIPTIGDSVIRFGEGSIIISAFGANRIAWGLAPSGGLSIGNGNSGPLLPNSPFASGKNSIAMGTGTRTTSAAEYSFAVGNDITNNEDNSFLVGFNNISSFFANELGVGVLTATPAPGAALDVNGRTRIQILDAVGTGNRFVVADGNGVLQSLAIPNNPNQVLLGNGQFGNQPPTADAWLLGGNGTVDIDDSKIFGVTRPNISLHVFAGGQQRMHLSGTNGRVSIGRGFEDARSRMHLHEPDAGVQEVCTQYTNLTTTPTGNPVSADGFKIGINAAGEAELLQQENKPLTISTNNTERIRVTEQGDIGIGIAAPQSTLDVNGTLTVRQALVLKATDSDDYFAITINSKGEITALPLEKKKIMIIDFA